MQLALPHVTRPAIEAGLDAVRSASRGRGTVEMIVARPAVDERVVLTEAAFTVADGLVDDGWRHRRSRTTRHGGPDPERQVTLVNARYLELIAGGRDRWPLAGDQLVVDLDLAADHLAPGDRLAAGSVVLELTAAPHTGCAKLVARFGRDALAVANDARFRDLHLRGVHARVVRPGTLRVGDAIGPLVHPGGAGRGR